MTNRLTPIVLRNFSLDTKVLGATQWLRPLQHCSGRYDVPGLPTEEVHNLVFTRHDMKLSVLVTWKVNADRALVAKFLAEVPAQLDPTPCRISLSSAVRTIR